MREKKSLSEKYRLLQVSAPPDVADWWDSLPDGAKSANAIKAMRAYMKRRKA